MSQENNDISNRLLILMQRHSQQMESIAMTYHNLPQPIRRIIAQYADTFVTSCDLINCNESIWMSIRDRIEGRTPHFIHPQAYSTGFCEGRKATLYTCISSKCVEFAERNHWNMCWDKHNEICPFRISLMKPVHLRGNGTFPDGPLSDFL